MTGQTSLFLADLAQFHFLRPFWLLLLLPVWLVWWRVRRRALAGPDVPKTIAPHLAAALTVGAAGRRRLQPIDSTAAVLTLLILAVAGPTWSRLPDPLLADTAPLVIALKVSDSMSATDVPPSRLERAKHKILDLLAARAGSRSGLIAYSGTAHQVVPLTEDAAILKPFLEGLSPEVMPRDGEAAGAALALANDVLSRQEAPGTVLFVLDDVSPADQAALATHVAEGGAPIVVWLVSGDAGARPRLQSLPGVTLIEATADRSDVAQVMRSLDAAYRTAQGQDERQDWNDRGWLLAWPAALVMLAWFRRGWTMRWLALPMAILVLQGSPASAEGWRDWFLTPDQQGRLAFEAKDYERAAELFEDPMWQAYSLYRFGRYEEAAELYAWQPSSQAAFGEGMALIKSRSYRGAIAAFEKALERDPGNEAAAHNLELAKYILDYVETTREQSDTGEERGIGADEIIYDNEAARGTETVERRDTGEILPETAEQWMRTVDTRTADFLKSRFALEVAQGQAAQ